MRQLHMAAADLGKSDPELPNYQVAGAVVTASEALSYFTRTPYRPDARLRRTMYCFIHSVRFRSAAMVSSTAPHSVRMTPT